MRDSVILVIGAGVVALFGLFAYLAFLSSRQQPQQAPTMQYIPIQANNENMSTEGAPDAPVSAVMTEEVAPTKPHIINHILNNANQWYVIEVPKDIRTWSMNARGTYDILYSFEPSHATYRTLFSGTFLDSDTAPNNINEIYVSSGTAGAVVEISMFR